MGKDFIDRDAANAVVLAAEEGATLGSGSLRLYATVPGRGADAAGVGIVGCVDLYSYDPLNRRCAVGIMVATDQRRQGYALAMLRALQRLAADTLHLHSLYADIAEGNNASVALFAKAGYTECGRFAEWLAVGDRFIDNIRMQLIL